MALTGLQRRVCKLLASWRLEGGESYLAGGAALNAWIEAPRLSRDLDIFHDREEAVQVAWERDRSVLVDAGFRVQARRELAGFVEAVVTAETGEGVRVEWVRDSAYRFFPLQWHDDLGLTLHPLDLATNKVLALVGRLEVRDWVDVLACDERIQPLGFLAWAACGKDPGFSPTSILEHAARTTRYSADEVRQLAFSGDPPDAGELARRWHAILAEARAVAASLPAPHAGACVLERTGADGSSAALALCRARATELPGLVEAGRLVFRQGALGGAVPAVGPLSPAP